MKHLDLDERFFLRIAAKNGLIRREDVDEVLALSAELHLLGNPKPIQSLLLDKGLVRARDVDRIHKAQRLTESLRLDLLYAETALRLRRVRKGLLQDALREHRKRDHEVHLGDHLLLRGLITETDHHDILQAIKGRLSDREQAYLSTLASKREIEPLQFLGDPRFLPTLAEGSTGAGSHASDSDSGAEERDLVDRMARTHADSRAEPAVAPEDAREEPPAPRPIRPKVTRTDRLPAQSRERVLAASGKRRPPPERVAAAPRAADTAQTASPREGGSRARTRSEPAARKRPDEGAKQDARGKSRKTSGRVRTGKDRAPKVERSRTRDRQAASTGERPTRSPKRPEAKRAKGGRDREGVAPARATSRRFPTSRKQAAAQPKRAEPNPLLDSGSDDVERELEDAPLADLRASVSAWIEGEDSNQQDHAMLESAIEIYARLSSEDDEVARTAELKGFQRRYKKRRTGGSHGGAEQPAGVERWVTAAWVLAVAAVIVTLLAVFVQVLSDS